MLLPGYGGTDDAQCAAMNVTNGKWRALDDSTNYFPYICTKKFYGNETFSCPIGAFSSFGTGVCYMYNSTKTTWQNAEKTCNAKGGYLASILDPTTNSIIQGLILFYDQTKNIKKFKFFLKNFLENLKFFRTPLKTSPKPNSTCLDGNIFVLCK